MDVTRAGGSSASPACTSPAIPGGVDENAKIGTLGIRIGLGWAKSHTLHHRPVPGHALQPPADAGDPARQDQIAKAVNATMISLDEAPQGYKDFDKGAAKKFVIDPHGLIKT